MQQIAEVTPNVKKLCFLSSIYIILAAGAIIAFLIYLDNVIHFNTIFDVFKELGAPRMYFSTILTWAVIGAIGVTILILILNYLTLGKVRYVFYEDRLVCYNNFLIMEISRAEIPYTNITKVSVDKPNTIKNANITIELTGMKKKNVILKFIDNAANVAAGIQNIIDTWKANYYAQYSQDYRLGKIAEGNY
jgi:hypothetical protein